MVWGISLPKRRNTSLCTGTPEYFTAPHQFERGELSSPVWTLPADQRDKVVAAIKAWWEAQDNAESGEPPLYYLIAGGWLNLGRGCGVRGGWSLYWIRFLNIFVAAALVWIGFVAAKTIFPNRQFVRVAVPSLIAAWPQSAFYSVQSDVLSPLTFGIAFVGLIKFLQTERPQMSLAVWTGLAIAATCLVKTVNIALLAVVGATMILKVRQLVRARRLGASFGSFSVLVFTAAVPIVLWFAWNVHAFGDPTATAAKIELLGWTRKPISNWLPHPIFTPRGLREFWPELMASFWRGEFIWHDQRLASGALDAFYWISSTLAFGLAATALLLRSGKLSGLQRQGLWLALLSFMVLVAFMALLSMVFDFGACVYPSNQHPYFTSGRLLCAATVPFFLFYACALDFAFGRINQIWPRLILLGAIFILIVISQCVVNDAAFLSRYNFFHLRSAP